MTPSPGRHKTRPDLVLFTLAMLLTAGGIVAVYSASYPRAAIDSGYGSDVLKAIESMQYGTEDLRPQTASQLREATIAQQAMMRKQLRWACYGLGCLLLALLLPYNLLRSRGFAVFWLWVAIVLLILVLFIGSDSGRESRRWLPLGGFKFQPSEFAKFALVLHLAAQASRLKQRIRRPTHFLSLLFWVGLIACLFVAEPHLGATMVLMGAALAVLFAAGADQRHLLAVMVAGLLLAGGSIALNGYQGNRLKVWLHPEQHDVLGYQAVHCGTALARGGVVGRGLGRSIEKFYYLPECYTDSVLAIVGEETGLLGTGVLLLLFIGFAACGLRIAETCPDPFGRLLAVGITAVIFLQAMLNFGVTSGLLPQTGVGLPFISYGGSSLCCFLGAVGLLLNISRLCPPRLTGPAARRAQRAALASRQGTRYNGR